MPKVHKSHPPSLKAQIAQVFGVHPTQVGGWKKQALAGLPAPGCGNLKRMLVDATAQLDRSERLLRQLLQTKTGRKSEQLSRETVGPVCSRSVRPASGAGAARARKTGGRRRRSAARRQRRKLGRRRGRKPLPQHLQRERVEHDPPETDKHCTQCDQDLRRIGKETSERYEYLPAQMKLIESGAFRPAGELDSRELDSQDVLPLRKIAMPYGSSAGYP
jgi:hypothetical protein